MNLYNTDNPSFPGPDTNCGALYPATIAAKTLTLTYGPTPADCNNVGSLWWSDPIDYCPDLLDPCGGTTTACQGENPFVPFTYPICFDEMRIVTNCGLLAVAGKLLEDATYDPSHVLMSGCAFGTHNWILIAQLFMVIDSCSPFHAYGGWPGMGGDCTSSGASGGVLHDTFGCLGYCCRAIDNCSYYLTDNIIIHA